MKNIQATEKYILRILNVCKNKNIIIMILKLITIFYLVSNKNKRIEIIVNLYY